MSVPNGKNAKISYFEAKAPIWVTNAAALGVPVALANSLQTKATAARAAFDAQQAAKAAWLTALGDCNIACAEMAQVGGQVVTLIRGTAKVEGDSIYTLAGLPIPPVPSPVPPPGQPYDPKTVLDGNGAVILTWKCANPPGAQGTTYQIYRQFSENDTPVYLSGVGEKKFVDATIPAGATLVVYKIQAVRSTAVGLWATFTVQFGTNAGGEATASVSSAASAPKLAA